MAAARAALGAQLGVLARRQARWAAEVAGAAPRGQSPGFPFGQRPGPNERREGGAWKKNELDLLRRTLLSLGLGRTDALLEAIRAQARGFKRGEADVRDGVAAFLEALVPHADAKDAPFLALKLRECRAEGDLRGFPVQRPEGLPDSGLPSAWHRVPSLGAGWAKRLRVLDHVADAIFLCTDKETQGQARAAIASIPDMARPASWWGFEQDVAILRGITRCGYGNYDAVRVSPEFAHHFAASTGTSRPREHKAMGKGSAHGKGCKCIVCRQSQGGAAGSPPAEGAADAAPPPSPPPEGAATAGEGALAAEEGAAADGPPPDEPGPSVEGEGEKKTGCSKCRFQPSGCRACSLEKAARPRDGGYDPPTQWKEEDESSLWPLSDVLTRRIKRIADNLAKLKRRINARQMFRQREAHRAQDWTKRERIDLLKALMQWGLPRESTSPDAQPHWGVLRELSGLERKSNQSMAKGYQGLMEEADTVIAEEAERIAALPKKSHAPDCKCIVCLQQRKRVPEGDEKASGAPGSGSPGGDDDVQNEGEPGEAGGDTGTAGEKGVEGTVEKLPRDSKKGARVIGGVLSPLMARHLKERILLFDSLQQAFASPWSWEISYPLQDLPPWWIDGQHDKILAQGLLLHGMSAYWEALKEDPQFASSEPQRKGPPLGEGLGDGADVQMEDAGGAAKPSAEEGGDSPGATGGAVSGAPGTGEEAGGDPTAPAPRDDFPSAKVCLKRLKQLASGYRKFCKSKRAKLRLRREARQKAKRQKLEAEAGADAGGADEGPAAAPPGEAEERGAELEAGQPDEEGPAPPPDAGAEEAPAVA